MKPRKKEDKNSYILPAVLLLLSAFFIFLFMIPEKKKAPVKTNLVQSQEFEKAVNRHLFSTSQHIELEQEKMALEASRLQSQGIKVQSGPNLEGNGVDLSTDPRAEALLKALGRDVKEPGSAVNPNDLVQSELFEEEQSNQYSEAYKKEYARQFVENARRAGWVVKLNDQYKVMSVQPLRKPSQNFDMFQGGGGGAVR